MVTLPSKSKLTGKAMADSVKNATSDCSTAKLRCSTELAKLLTIINRDMKLTQDMVQELMSGAALVLHCESVKELNAAQQTAYRGRQNLQGREVRVQRDSKTLTLTLTCTAVGEQLGRVRRSNGKHTAKVLTKDCK